MLGMVNIFGDLPGVWINASDDGQTSFLDEGPQIRILVYPPGLEILICHVLWQLF